MSQVVVKPSRKHNIIFMSLDFQALAIHSIDCIELPSTLGIINGRAVAPACGEQYICSTVVRRAEKGGLQGVIWCERAALGLEGRDEA